MFNKLTNTYLAYDDNRNNTLLNQKPEIIRLFILYIKMGQGAFLHILGIFYVPNLPSNDLKTEMKRNQRMFSLSLNKVVNKLEKSHGIHKYQWSW